MNGKDTTQQIEAEEIISSMNARLAAPVSKHKPCTPEAHADVVGDTREVMRGMKWIIRHVAESKEPSGNWLQFGKWKAGGIPAIILAIFFGLFLWQQYQANRVIGEARAVATDVRQVKEHQENVVSECARILAKAIVAEMKDGKP